jgi:hypothetical protein
MGVRPVAESSSSSAEARVGPGSENLTRFFPLDLFGVHGTIDSGAGGFTELSRVSRPPCACLWRRVRRSAIGTSEMLSSILTGRNGLTCVLQTGMWEGAAEAANQLTSSDSARQLCPEQHDQPPHLAGCLFTRFPNMAISGANQRDPLRPPESNTPHPYSLNGNCIHQGACKRVASAFANCL